MSKKNWTIRTRVFGGFIFIEILVLVANCIGYMAASRMLNAKNPELFLRGYGIFTLVDLIVTLLLTSYVTMDVVKALRYSIGDLSEAGKKMSRGDTDIIIEKRNNDEFGVLVDQFKEMIANSQEEARIVESVADGNLVVEVRPKSECDTLGNSLKKLVETTRHTMNSINEAAGSVLISASEVASASEALAQGSTEQARDPG